MREIDKDRLLNRSKTFCMLPWVHIHANATGKIYPCSAATGKQIGHTAEISLRDSFNSEEMKQLRLDMLGERFNSFCTQCHNHEGLYNNGSFRIYNNEIYSKYFDDTVLQTQEDGTLAEFKLYYFDTRFDNTCNFKCRTCSNQFSSQWEKEDSDHKGIKIYRPQNITNSVSLLEEAIQQIPHIKKIQFSGGEPTVTSEHYAFLEELIYLEKTHIPIVYHTNCSSLNYKNKDLLTLWKHFSNIEVVCSFDHFGQKAQYIRHGTIWPEIQENFLKIKQLENVTTRIAVVLSIYNYLTLGDFFIHLLLSNMLQPGDPTVLINKISDNKYSSRILPKQLKEIGRQNLLEFVPKLNSKDAWMFPEDQILEITDCIEFTESVDLWDANKSKFQEETRRLDRIRQENFIEIFPELESLMDGAPKQKPPVV